MRLADFILDDLDSILREWETFARTMQPAALTMTPVELRNHAALMLKVIAEDLRQRQSLKQQILKSHGQEPRPGHGTGEGHGIARLESNFTVEQLVSEYRALRSSVLRRWMQTHAAPRPTDLDDIIRFNEAIDQLMAASIFSFAHAKRAAEETEKQRRNQFLAMLAHELRNPLSPISTAAAILKKARKDEAVIENVSNIISRQVMHMASLVDDLLDVSRVTRGLVKIKLEAVDMCRVIDDAVEQVTPQIDARQHTLTVTQLPHPTLVQGDEKRLVQVVTNLLTNAAKYTPERGRLALQAMLQDDGVVIVVQDNGIGIAVDFIPHVFDLFAQAERTCDRSPGGLGLGLALVKRLVELHGGKVSCSSAGLGEGSRFTVWLPLAQGAADEAERLGTLLT